MPRSRLREHVLDLMWLLVVAIAAAAAHAYARGGEAARPETTFAPLSRSACGANTPAARFLWSLDR